MLCIFCAPLTLIALYESVFRSRQNSWMKSWFRTTAGEGEDDTPENRDPETREGGGELRIARVPFEELVRVFPDAAMSEERAIIKEIREVRGMLAEVLRRMDEDAQAKAQAGEGGKKRRTKKKSGSSSSSSSD